MCVLFYIKVSFVAGEFYAICGLSIVVYRYCTFKIIVFWFSVILGCRGCYNLVCAVLNVCFIYVGCVLHMKSVFYVCCGLYCESVL